MWYTKRSAAVCPLAALSTEIRLPAQHDIFLNIFKPPTVHVPAALLQSVARRAQALGISRNRLVVGRWSKPSVDAPPGRRNFWTGCGTWIARHARPSTSYCEA